jgi:hypothetical protein
MPNATINFNEYEKYDLKTLDGAFVMLRPLPYGMKLQRRDKAMKMSMEQKVEKRGRRRQVVDEDVQKINLETLSEWSTLFDFKHCIGEHNLEDAAGNPLDLGSPMTMQILSPKVGSEIETLIGNLNDDEDEESLEDFISRSTNSSQPTSDNLTTLETTN